MDKQHLAKNQTGRDSVTAVTPGEGDVARLMSRDYFCVGMVSAVDGDTATVVIHDTPFPEEEGTEVRMPLAELLLY